MYGPRYVWMIPGYIIDGWWAVPDKHVTCTPEELRRASEGYLALTWSMFGREEVVTQAGIVSYSIILLQEYASQPLNLLRFYDR